MITVRANARNATYISNDLITSGSVGIPVTFNLSEDFDGLSAIAVFEGSGTARDVALIGDSCVVPHEVLTTAGGYLRIGIYAANSEGTIVIPTVWAGSKIILQGTEPSEVDPSAPTPSWAAQVQEAAAEALANSEEAIEIAGGAEAAAEEARQSASDAAASATAAGQSASAADDAQTAAEAASGAAASARDAAVAAQGSAENSAQAAAGSATAAAGSAAAAAASEAAARAVQESIPEDYADLSADVVDLKSQFELEAYESGVIVDVSSLTKINKWLKEVPPSTVASSAAYSVAVDITAYRTGCLYLKTAVITNTATDPKYLWAIVDKDDNVIDSSPYQYTAQSVDDKIVIPDDAVTLWVGTDTTNISNTIIRLYNTRLNVYKAFDETRYDKNVVFDVSDLRKVENKYWLTSIPPESSSSSNAAATFKFNVSQYIGVELHLKASVIRTASTTQKYLYAITDEANDILIASDKTYGAQSVDTIITIPANATYLWVGLDTTNYDDANVYVRMPIDYQIARLENSIKKPVYPIICWGDSLTAGAGWIGVPSGYPVVLSEEFGVECKNAGVGGETSSTIAARMGAIPVVIPAGAINGTYATDALKDQWGNPVQPLKNDTSDTKGTVNPVLINGEEATITINTSTNEYTISGYSGDASAVPVEMTFHGQELTGAITVICAGQNDTGIALEQVMARIDSMIDHCAGEWLVLGRPTGDAESRASEEAAMLNKYGGRYLNSRHVVSQYGMTIMELTPTSADTAAIEAGAIPPSLLYDTVHLNESGYRAWGKFIAMRIRALGFDKLLN